MKKLIIISGILGLASGLYAANVVQPMPSPISVLTAAQVLTSTPTYVGQMIICSNCTSANGGLGIPCLSTETANANNAYILAGSSLTATTACK